MTIRILWTKKELRKLGWPFSSTCLRTKKVTHHCFPGWTISRKAREKWSARIARLVEFGHELRRPEADFLRDGIYELRASYQGVHYRMLYFFSGKAIVVRSHGLTKQREVPKGDIDRAVAPKEEC